MTTIILSIRSEWNSVFVLFFSAFYHQQNRVFSRIDAIQRCRPISWYR